MLFEIQGLQGEGSVVTACFRIDDRAKTMFLLFLVYRRLNNPEPTI